MVCLLLPLLLASRTRLRHRHLHHYLGTDQDQKTEAEAHGRDQPMLAVLRSFLSVAGCPCLTVFLVLGLDD